MANATALGESGYCAKITPLTNIFGMDIKYANGSNHWFPATLDTCCAACRFLDSCQAWVLGTNNNDDCSGFTDPAVGCCWLKSGTGPVRASKYQQTGQYTSTAHRDSANTHGGSGEITWSWVFIAIIGAGFLLYLVVGFVFNQVTKPQGGSLPHAAFWRELGGLVGDGFSSTLALIGLRGGQPAQNTQYVSAEEQNEIDRYRARGSVANDARSTPTTLGTWMNQGDGGGAARQGQGQPAAAADKKSGRASRSSSSTPGKRGKADKKTRQKKAQGSPGPDKKGKKARGARAGRPSGAPSAKAGRVVY